MSLRLVWSTPVTQNETLSQKTTQQDMVQWLSVLREDLGSDLSTHSECLITAVTPVLGNMSPPSGLQEHLYACGAHINPQSYIHIKTKLNKSF